jgi:formamidopyrimidine-DNA glycosylase
MRGLAARLQGQTIRHAELRRADLRWPIPAGFAARLTGAHVVNLARRAKYIFIRLAARPGATADTVLLHLGMSGRVTIARDRANDAPSHVAHEHLVLTTEDGWRLALVDPRRFGSLDLFPTEFESAQKLIASLGPEPLEDSFTPQTLEAALKSRRTPLKAALLDQRVVAGLGNIYVCEALFRAGLSPRRLAATVRGARAARLVACIKATLTEAIAAGGSSLRDYVQPNGELGYFQHAWKVYGREGEPCAHCPGPPHCPGITRLVQSGRSTFFCTRSQK